MALKRKITKADYDKLAADLKTEYVADGDDNYRLDLDGEEDTGALKRAKDRETQLRKDAEKKAAEETPPHTWGRQSSAAVKPNVVRNTPTYVGKTFVNRCAIVLGRKHPHIRGEDAIDETPYPSSRVHTS